MDTDYDLDCTGATGDGNLVTEQFTAVDLIHIQDVNFAWRAVKVICEGQGVTTISNLILMTAMLPASLCKMYREGAKYTRIDSWKPRSQVSECMRDERRSEARPLGVQKFTIGADHREGPVPDIATELDSARLDSAALPARSHGGVLCTFPRLVGRGDVCGAHGQAISHISRNLNTMQSCGSIFVAIISGSDHEKDIVLPCQLIEFACPTVRLHRFLNSLHWTEAKIHDLVLAASNSFLDLIEYPVAIEITRDIRCRKNSEAINWQRRSWSLLPGSYQPIEHGACNPCTVLKVVRVGRFLGQVA